MTDRESVALKDARRSLNKVVSIAGEAYWKAVIAGWKLQIDFNRWAEQGDVSRGGLFFVFAVGTLLGVFLGATLIG